MWPRSFAGGKRNRREKNYLLSWSWIVSGSGSKLFRSHCCLWKSGKGINLTTWFSIHVLLAWFSFPPMDLTYFQWRSPFIIFPSCHSSLLCLCHFSCISIFHLAILPLSCFIACGSFCSTLFISLSIENGCGSINFHWWNSAQYNSKYEDFAIMYYTVKEKNHIHPLIFKCSSTQEVRTFSSPTRYSKFFSIFVTFQIPF